MKIEWNKVTWYSKLFAVIVFLVVFAVAFYLGKLDTQTKNEIKSIPQNIAQDDPSGWKTYQSKEFGFEFSYPKGWVVSIGHIMSTQGTTTVLSPIGDDLQEINIGGAASCDKPYVVGATECKYISPFTISTFSKDQNTLNIFDKVISSFKLTK